MKRCWIVGAALVCFAQAGAARNACELLTQKDLHFVSAKLSNSTRGELAVSQCFYEAPSFTDSVSLMMMTGSNDAVRRYWKANISDDGKTELWSGNYINGAYYVRARGAILRISPGGPGGVKEKTARAKALARRALRRL